MNKKCTIGEVAKLFDVSTDTLRYYEKAGILSADKDKDNGYRYYSYDEIVVLMDILFFRNMELPVKNIREIITQMEIADIKKMLYQNQSKVENRIQELIKLQKMIAKVAAHYELCEQQIGKFAIVPAPSFKYKLIDNQNDDVVAIIKKYKKADWAWMDSIRYTLVVPEAELLTSPNFITAQVGISLDQENLCMLNAAEQQELSYLNEGEYLYTIVSTTYKEQVNDILSKALAYLKARGRQVKGSLLGRYLASSHKDGLDYYEIWLPIEET